MSDTINNETLAYLIKRQDSFEQFVIDKIREIQMEFKQSKQKTESDLSIYPLQLCAYCFEKNKYYIKSSI